MTTKLDRWTVMSGGQTTCERIEAMEEADQNPPLGRSARQSLMRLAEGRRPEETHELVLIRGSDLGTTRNRRTEAIHREGARRRLFRPTPDAALLLRDALPMEAQEYRLIVFMHKPIRDREQHPSLLCWQRKVVRGIARHAVVLLEAYPATIWPRDAAFVFRASPESVQGIVRPRAGYSRPYPQASVRQRPCWAV